MKEVDVTHGSENEAGVKEAKCLKHAFFLLASGGGGLHWLQKSNCV